jgi:thiol-disulfide isomerase/thioredoxin
MTILLHNTLEQYMSPFLTKNHEFRNRVRASFFCLLFCLVFSPSFLFAAGKMPNFILPDASKGGAKVKSATFQGKTLLVTFFATWCPPCMQEVPVLIELQKQFAQSNFSVIGLSVDDGVEVVAKLIEIRSINYPVLMADDATARDFGGLAGIPTSFLVNKEGVVVKKYPGMVPYALLEKDIKKIMN